MHEDVYLVLSSSLSRWALMSAHLRAYDSPAIKEAEAKTCLDLGDLALLLTLVAEGPIHY